MGKELGWEEGGRNLIPIFPLGWGQLVTMVYSYAFLLSFPVVFHWVPTSLSAPEDCFDLGYQSILVALQLLHDHCPRVGICSRSLISAPHVALAWPSPSTLGLLELHQQGIYNPGLV